VSSKYPQMNWPIRVGHNQAATHQIT